MKNNIQLKGVLTVIFVSVLVGGFIFWAKSKSDIMNYENMEGFKQVNTKVEEDNESSDFSIRGKVTFGDCMPSPEPKKHDPYTGKIYFVAVSNLQSSQDRNAPNFFSVSPAASVIDGKYSANIPTGEYYAYLPGIPDTRNSITISPNQHLVKNLDYCTAY